MLHPKLIPWQYEVVSDTHRFRVVDAGRRAGKSVLAELIAIDWATKWAGGVIYIVSPTYRQSKSIHWRQLNQFIPREWIKKKNEVELAIELNNGSRVELKGAENPDALRGVKLRGLIIDEIASIRNWDWLWEEVLRPTLTDYQSPAVFISTPKGYNSFYDLYQLGQGSNPDYKSWKFTTYDNPKIKVEEINNAKKELSEDTFHQEYMADFRKYTGLVYKVFSRETHVVDPFTLPDSWSIYRGIDFGSTNPTACLWIAVDNDDNFYVISEHYQTGETIDYHAGVINANSYSRLVNSTYGDPSGAQWISEFAQRGVYITPANKETGQDFNGWVRFGIDRVSQKLKPIPGHRVTMPEMRGSLGRRNGNEPMPSLFIFSNCTNLIREFELYRWKEKREGMELNNPEQPEKVNDHALDALRYFIVSYQKETPLPKNLNDFSKFRI